MDDLIILGELLNQVSLPQNISIRRFSDNDFLFIQALFQKEGWLSLVNRPEEGLNAWKNSTITLVAVAGDKIIGAIRALTDKEITVYVAELLVDADYRGIGIGKALLDVCHNMYPNTRFDLLSEMTSTGFYKKNGFRESIGFRKNY